MKTWITITEDDINAQLNTAQSEAFLTRPHRGQSSDPFTPALDETIARVRAAIRSQSTNTLAEDETTIPPELKRTASLLVLFQLPGRIGGITLTYEQEDYIAEAEDVLDRVRDGDLPVSLPDGPEDAPDVRTSFGLEVARKREQRTTGRDLRGL